MKTNFIDNYYKAGNMDAALGFNNSIRSDGTGTQKDFIQKIVVFDGDNGNFELLKDDVDMLYVGDIGTIEDYEEDEKEGIKAAITFPASSFAGTFDGVALAQKGFFDFRKGASNFSSGVITYSAGKAFTNSDIARSWDKVLDVIYEKNEILTLGVKYDNELEQYTATICKYIKNFDSFNPLTTGNAFLKEVYSIDITDLMAIPNGENWETVTNSSLSSKVFYGVDEKNGKYYIIFMAKNAKVFSTLSIDREDLTQTELHRMILPNDVSFLTQTSWYYPYSTWPSSNPLNYHTKLFPANFYKGDFVFLLNATRIIEGEPVSDKYLCLINPEDSTDIEAIETHYFYQQNEQDWTSYYPADPSEPLINSECGSLISKNFVVKNGIGYVIRSNTFLSDLNMSYYKGFMLLSSIDNSGVINFEWTICPFCLSFIQRMSSKVFKALNRSMTYTFKLLNNGVS